MKLVTVTNDELKQGLRDLDVTLLYPLKSFSIGYDITYDIDDIDDFVLINRILDDNDLDRLENILKNSQIKGIVFDDLGILEIVKDLNIKKILLLDHLATNVRSINYYLDYVDSVVISSDLKKSEIEHIIKMAKKPVVVNVFGLKKLMYSRRLLLSNYETYHKLEKNEKLEASINDQGFIIKENEFGTCFYAKKYYNALELLDSKNVLYFWYDLIDIDFTDAIDIIKKSKVNVLNDTGFLDKEIYYKLKGDKNA